MLLSATADCCSTNPSCESDDHRSGDEADAEWRSPLCDCNDDEQRAGNQADGEAGPLTASLRGEHACEVEEETDDHHDEKAAGP